MRVRVAGAAARVKRAQCWSVRGGSPMLRRYATNHRSDRLSEV